MQAPHYSLENFKMYGQSVLNIQNSFENVSAPITAEEVSLEMRPETLRISKSWLLLVSHMIKTAMS
jgi:hypothetical protein